MPPILFIRYEPAQGEAKEFRFSSGMLTMGRETGNDIVVPSNSVSRQHVRILPAGNHWLIADLGSTNGTWLNDETISANHFKMLRSGDEVILADSRFKIRLKAEAGHPIGRFVRSVLVFEGEKFLSEFSLENPNAVFTVGGSGSHAKIPGSTGVQLEIKTGEQGIIAAPVEGFVGAELNGSLLRENSALVDGDQVKIGTFTFIVNDSERTIVSDTSVEHTVFADQTSVLPAVVEEEEEYRPNANVPRGWETEGRREQGAGRRFIFGAEEEQYGKSSEGTMTVPALQVKKIRGEEQTGFDMNISRRVSAVTATEPLSPKQQRQKRLILGIAFIAGALILLLGLILTILLK